jgi:hypothetical protein
LPWSFGKLTAYRTTGRRPALFPVSRLYRIGYNALLSPLSSLDPLSGQAFSFGFGLCPYSVVKVLFIFQLHCRSKSSFERIDKLASMFID